MVSYLDTRVLLEDGRIRMDLHSYTYRGAAVTTDTIKPPFYTTRPYASAGSAQREGLQTERRTSYREGDFRQRGGLQTERRTSDREEDFKQRGGLQTESRRTETIPTEEGLQGTGRGDSHPACCQQTKRKLSTAVEKRDR